MIVKLSIMSKIHNIFIANAGIAYKIIGNAFEIINFKFSLNLLIINILSIKIINPKKKAKINPKSFIKINNENDKIIFVFKNISI